MTKWNSLLLLSSLMVAANTRADGRVYAIRTNPLSCDYCAYDLEQKFLHMQGVKDFEVDIDGVLFVTTDDSVKLTEPFVRKILLDNGFDYKGMTEKQHEQ
jgi:copper chaperone CopZ